MMRVFVSRVITYATFIVCGGYLLLEMTKTRAITKISNNPSIQNIQQDDWKAKRVLFGTGSLSAEDMRAICFNKTLMSEDSAYPLIQKTLHYSIQRTFYMCNRLNMMVCSAPKAGSKFWTSTMAAITGAINEDANSLLPSNTVHSILVKAMKVDYESIKTRFDGYKIITARNPYTRLFSAYIEQVFLPTDWALSTQIRDHVKGSRDPSEKFCLNDLTFSDFLLYVTKDSKAFSDAHWVPITDLCELCGKSKVLIVREENFINDTRQVLTKVGLPEDRVETLTLILEKKIAKQTLSLVGLLLHNIFQQNHHYCLSTVDILKRIWKSLQLQGRISRGARLSEGRFANETSFKKVVGYFQGAVAASISSKPMSPEKIKLQRNGAVIAEYKTIHPGIIENIRKIYYNDFALFNYDTHIPSVQTLK